MNKCKHHWHVEHTVYRGRNDNPYSNEKCIRRFCKKCGLVQHSYTGRWYKSNIGPGKIWGKYPKEMNKS